MSATATSFSTVLSSVGASYIQLQGEVSSGELTFGCSLAGCGSCTPPAHGVLSDFDPATGVVVYTPNSGYTGADSLTFVAIQDGSTTSSEATVSITVTSARTTVTDYLLKPDGSSRGGTVTFILTQPVTSPAGLIPGSATVSATVDVSTGLFSCSLYPSTSLSPQAYYQLWWGTTNNLRQELIGVYEIPASAEAITLAGHRITDANLAAQYSFVSAAGFNAFLNRAFAITISNNGSTVGTRGGLNLIPGSNISFSMSDNSGSDRVDVTINGPAGGGTGGSVNSGTSGRIPYYASTGTTIGPLTLGSANQVLGVNSGATGHEYKTITAGTGMAVTHGTNSVTITNDGVVSINGNDIGAQVIQIGTDTCGSAPGVSSSSGVTTICIPLASTTRGGYVNVGTQTIAGAKTITGDATDDTPLTVTQKASGSDFLQFWKDSSGTAFGSFNVNANTGGLHAAKLAAGNSGSTPSAGYTLAVQNASSTINNGSSGAIINTALTANDTSGSIRGLYVTYTLIGTGTHSGANRAIDASFTFAGSGTATTATGVRSQIANSSTGTITAARAFYSTANLSGGSTVTNFYHFYSAAPTIDTATVTNQYGLYVEALTAATNNWAIYTAGATGSSLGGFLDLRGRTAPSLSNSSEARAYADANGLIALSQSGGPYSWLQGVPVIAKTADYSVSVTDIKTRFTNAGASGTVVFTLPVAQAGLTYAFYILASQTLRVTAGTGATIRSGSNVTSSAGNASASTVGNVLVITAVSSTSWIAESITGTWTWA